MNKKYYKKMCTFLLVLVAATAFAGCSTDSPRMENSNIKTNQSVGNANL